MKTSEPRTQPAPEPNAIDDGLLAERTGIYMIVVMVVMIAASLYGYRESSLFACQPPANPADDYIAYCGSTGFGDYDYGAFWFALESVPVQASANAEVLFLGSSRLQFAFSSAATEAWFKGAGASYYLLGFAYDGNYHFAQPLLRKLQPEAGVYIVNIDLFFEPDPTPPARAVMYDSTSESKYRRKQSLHALQQFICSRASVLCGKRDTIYRSRDTGYWHVAGVRFVSSPVSFDREIDSAYVQDYVAAAREFLDELPVPPECQILTMAPTVGTRIESARTIAASVGRTFIAPELDGLITYDGSHLDGPSADHWSAAFFAEAGPSIRDCLGGR